MKNINRDIDGKFPHLFNIAGVFEFNHSLFYDSLTIPGEELEIDFPLNYDDKDSWSFTPQHLYGKIRFHIKLKASSRSR